MDTTKSPVSMVQTSKYPLWWEYRPGANTKDSNYSDMMCCGISVSIENEIKKSDNIKNLRILKNTTF